MHKVVLFSPWKCYLRGDWPESDSKEGVWKGRIKSHGICESCENFHTRLLGLLIDQVLSFVGITQELANFFEPGARLLVPGLLGPQIVVHRP